MLNQRKGAASICSACIGYRTGDSKSGVCFDFL